VRQSMSIAGGAQSGRWRGLVWCGATVLSVWLTPRTAYALRPFDSTDASVADRATCEVELGPVGYFTSVDGRFLVAPMAVVNFGLTNRLELVVEGTNAWTLEGPSSSGLRDNAVALKAVLREGSLQDTRGFSLGVEATTLLPSADEGGVGQEVAGLLSRRWAYGTVHLNGTIGITRSDELLRAVGLIGEGPDSWRVRPVAEVLIERAESRTASALVGAIWQPRDGLLIDAGYRRARVDDFTGNEFRVGMTFSFRLTRS
jgi:hypothetical protein